MHFILCILYLLLVQLILIECKVNKVEEEFKTILKTEKYVAAIFTKECCSCVQCVEAEALLGTISADLERILNIHVVKLVTQTKLQKRYGVNILPSLLFIRDGIPSLYDGAFELEAVQEWLSQNMESSLKDLNDDNFEHLTQAATGSTTGDWLTAFYNSSCVKQKAWQAVLDGLAARLKNKINVAQVHIEENPGLVERFKIADCPAILFFHHGKFYQYSPPDISIAALRKFAEGWYKNFKAAPVPAPKSPFDKLVDSSVQLIKDQDTLIKVVGCLGIATVFAILFYCYLRTSGKDIKKD